MLRNIKLIKETEDDAKKWKKYPMLLEEFMLLKCHTT